MSFRVAVAADEGYFLELTIPVEDVADMIAAMAGNPALSIAGQKILAGLREISLNTDLAVAGAATKQ